MIIHEITTFRSNVTCVEKCRAVQQLVVDIMFWLDNVLWIPPVGGGRGAAQATPARKEMGEDFAKK